jgi:hypothetical protein
MRVQEMLPTVEMRATNPFQLHANQKSMPSTNRSLHLIVLVAIRLKANRSGVLTMPVMSGLTP